MDRRRFVTALGCIALSIALASLSATAFLEPPVKTELPPGAEGAKERLNTSPRHGEWAEIEVPGLKQKMKAFVVYPEVKEKAPVVIVIQEIFGLSDWIRSVADQLAADGFIAIAPDLLTGKGLKGGGTEDFGSVDDVRKAVMGLKNEDVKTMLDATRAYGLKLPAASGKSATIGFCWGGGTSFRYATQQPDLNAAVVYYGTSPDSGYDKIKCPVLGLYGGNDERVNSTIPKAETAMKEAGQKYSPNKFENAGHGFLRQQDGPKDHPGANKKAAEEAWPKTIEFLRANTK